MMVINLTLAFVFVTVFIYNVSSYGEYVPKSIYLLDHNGQKTNEFNVRSRRDLESAIKRFKRYAGNGDGGGSAHSYSGSYSHSGNPGSFIPDFSNLANIPSNLGDIKKHVEGFANLHSRSGIPQTADNLGYKGPILFSRSGVDRGTGVEVSGAAQGPHGAFSSSSSSIDHKGNIKYDVKSGKY